MNDAPREIWTNSRATMIVTGFPPWEGDVRYIRADAMTLAECKDVPEVQELVDALRALDHHSLGSGPSTDMRKLHEAQMQARAVLRKMERSA